MQANVNLSDPADVRYLYYCIMLHDGAPSGSSAEKYLELVKSGLGCVVWVCVWCGLR